MEKELKHPPINFGKTGVLVINLGTPDSTSWFDIRKYLKEFLSDKRVIEVNPIIWQVILNVFILNQLVRFVLTGALRRDRAHRGDHSEPLGVTIRWGGPGGLEPCVATPGGRGIDRSGHR